MNPTVRPADVPADVLKLCRELARHGYKAWIVGGCLRDLLRGHPAADWDLATTARPEQVQKVFHRVIPTGIQHGTVTVRLGGHGYEVTTLRGEGAYSDGRRPDTIEFVEDIVADLARRDFTVNAIAYDPLEHTITDPFDGVGDLNRRMIRAVGRAGERFSEDGLRVLRAARFVATLEFELDADTEAAIRPTLDTFRKVSAERVREEWVKALKARAPSRAFVVMARTGILDVTLPLLAHVPPATWDAALRALDWAPVDLRVRMAALLSPWAEDPDAAGEWLTRYRFSNQEREHIVRMLRFMREPWQPLETDVDVRRFAQRVGRPFVREVITLARDVAQARFGPESDPAKNAAALGDRVHALIRPDVALTAKELTVSGRDLMTELELKPGPVLGQIIEALLDRVIEDPSQNTRERLLELARHVHQGG